MSAAAVLLCGDAGLDVIAPAGVETVVVDGLCEHPQAAAAALRRLGADRVVLGLCERRPSRELLGALRRAGAAPFGIAAVVLADHGEEARVLLAAAVARLAALAPDERGRPALGGGGMSRRALFSPSSIVETLPVAALAAEACAQTASCGLCVAQCPAQAIAATHPVPTIDAAACTACGLCVPRCPTGALRLAGCSTAQIEAQLEVLFGEVDGIVFACSAAAATAPPGWALVELPTLTLLTPGWILQTRARGVEVELAPCEGECCAAAGEVEVLAELLIGADGVLQPPVAGGPIRLGEPLATADALRRRGGTPRVPLIESPRSPLGRLTLDRDRCTVCGACAIVCPTRALALDEDGSGSALRHDPGTCVACERCVSVCPEAALDVRRAIDVARLREGELELTRDARQRCTVCGTELPPWQMRRRLRELLPLIEDTPLELCTGCAARVRQARACMAAPGTGRSSIELITVEPSTAVLREEGIEDDRGTHGVRGGSG